MGRPEDLREDIFHYLESLSHKLNLKSLENRG